MSDIITVPSYNNIDTYCADIELPLGASELHGLICGIFAVTDDKKTVIEALETLLSEGSTDEINITSELSDLIESTTQELAAPDFAFQLLLPEDEQDLAERTKALGFWAQGFVSGLGEGGMQLSTNDHDELTEIINDLTSIAQVDSNDIGNSDEEDVALTELEEYLRVAAMTIYTDLLLQNKNIVETEKSDYVH